MFQDDVSIRWKRNELRSLIPCMFYYNSSHASNCNACYVWRTIILGVWLCQYSRERNDHYKGHRIRVIMHISIGYGQRMIYLLFIIIVLQGTSSLRSLIPFRLSHLLEISAHASIILYSLDQPCIYYILYANFFNSKFLYWATIRLDHRCICICACASLCTWPHVPLVSSYYM